MDDANGSFTSNFQQALSDAQSLAMAQDSSALETLHLLHALLHDAKFGASEVLQAAGVAFEPLMQDVNKELENLPKLNNPNPNLVPSAQLLKTLSICDQLAKHQQDSYVAIDVFWLALLEDRSIAGELFKNMVLVRKI